MYGYIWRLIPIGDKLYYCVLYSSSGNYSDVDSKFIDRILDIDFEFSVNGKNRKIGRSRIFSDFESDLTPISKNIESFLTKEEFFKERTGKDFSSLYLKYYPKLTYFINKICDDTQLAEDISTESFFIALDKIDKYDIKYQFSTWLFTIAKNIALQDKKVRVGKIKSIDSIFGEDTTMNDFITDDDRDFRDIAFDYNTHEDFYNAIDMKADIMRNQIIKLKEPYRTVIKMREIDKMSYQDIADILGKNLNTIKSQIKNGRKLLINKTKSDFDIIDKKMDN